MRGDVPELNGSPAMQANSEQFSIRRKGHGFSLVVEGQLANGLQLRHRKQPHSSGVGGERQKLIVRRENEFVVVHEPVRKSNSRLATDSASGCGVPKTKRARFSPIDCGGPAAIWRKPERPCSASEVV